MENLRKNIVVWIATIVIIAGFLVLIVSPFLLLGYILDSTACKATGKKLNVKTEYSFFAGCIVEKANGERFLLQQLRNIKMQ